MRSPTLPRLRGTYFTLFSQKVSGVPHPYCGTYLLTRYPPPTLDWALGGRPLGGVDSGGGPHFEQIFWGGVLVQIPNGFTRPSSQKRGARYGRRQRWELLAVCFLQIPNGFTRSSAP